MSKWPCVADADIIFLSCFFMVALCNRTDHYIFILWLLLSSLWPPYVIGGPLYFCPVVSFFFYLLLLSSFFSSPNLSGRRSDVYTWRGPSVNLECRSEMYCTRLAANAGPKKVAENRHLGTVPLICRAISSQLRHVSTIGKKLVKQQ